MNRWMKELQQKHRLKKLIIGMEPTGHYWFNLANWLADKELHVIMVNPASSADDTGCTGGQGMRNRGTIRKYSPGSFYCTHTPQTRRLSLAKISLSRESSLS
ncbi:IS110 family transposase [Paenibacillus sp. PL91]|uniref:IS110 family transposase n=1 Tax=Paenibacillus sp. PL91 TaxID=2729538 RepID=UPI001CB89D39|nr:IS110 family transposase [Paenibacillus sp. PL91]